MPITTAGRYFLAICAAKLRATSPKAAQPSSRTAFLGVRFRRAGAERRSRAKPSATPSPMGWSEAGALARARVARAGRAARLGARVFLFFEVAMASLRIPPDFRRGKTQM